MAEVNFVNVCVELVEYDGVTRQEINSERKDPSKNQSASRLGLMEYKESVRGGRNEVTEDGGCVLYWSSREW